MNPTHDNQAQDPVDGGRRTFLGVAAGLTAATVAPGVFLQHCDRSPAL